MSVKNFKFVSPGVFINEIDNSFIPKSADAIGPNVIGRSSRGLAMQPVEVDSYSEFVEVYGGTAYAGYGGSIRLTTGVGTSTSSGAVLVNTANAGKTGVSGSMTLSTGTSSLGKTGYMNLITGESTSGKGGYISIKVGARLRVVGSCCREYHRA